MGLLVFDASRRSSLAVSTGGERVQTSQLTSILASTAGQMKDEFVEFKKTTTTMTSSSNSSMSLVNRFNHCKKVLRNVVNAKDQIKLSRTVMETLGPQFNISARSDRALSSYASNSLNSSSTAVTSADPLRQPQTSRRMLKAEKGEGGARNEYFSNTTGAGNFFNKTSRLQQQQQQPSRQLRSQGSKIESGRLFENHLPHQSELLNISGVNPKLNSFRAVSPIRPSCTEGDDPRVLEGKLPAAEAKLGSIVLMDEDNLGGDIHYSLKAFTANSKAPQLSQTQISLLAKLTEMVINPSLELTGYIADCEGQDQFDNEKKLQRAQTASLHLNRPLKTEPKLQPLTKTTGGGRGILKLTRKLIVKDSSSDGAGSKQVFVPLRSAVETTNKQNLKVANISGGSSITSNPGKGRGRGVSDYVILKGRANISNNDEKEHQPTSQEKLKNLIHNNVKRYEQPPPPPQRLELDLSFFGAKRKSEFSPGILRGSPGRPSLFFQSMRLLKPTAGAMPPISTLVDTGISMMDVQEVADDDAYFTQVNTSNSIQKPTMRLLKDNAVAATQTSIVCDLKETGGYLQSSLPVVGKLQLLDASSKGLSLGMSEKSSGSQSTDQMIPPKTAGTVIRRRKASKVLTSRQSSATSDQQKRIDMRGLKKLATSEDKTNPLSASKFSDSLAFWKKLKREIYHVSDEIKENNMLEEPQIAASSQSIELQSMKKYEFDKQTFHGLVQLTGRLQSMIDNMEVKDEEDTYSKIMEELDAMVESVREFKNVSSFFLVRLFTLQGKFAYVCGNIYHAMRAFLAAKRLSKQLNDLRRKLRLHHYIGSCFKLLKNFHNSKQQFIKMLKLAWVNENQDVELKAYDELGIAFFYGCELDIAQRLHIRLCSNITEHKDSSIRKTIVDGVHKQLRYAQEMNDVGISTKFAIQNFQGENGTNKHLLDVDKGKTPARKGMFMKKQSGGPAFSAASSVQANTNDQVMEGKDGSSSQQESVTHYSGNIAGIDIEFSDSSDEEADFFIREMTQRDVALEEKEQKQREIDARAEPSLKNIRLRYSKFAQERESDKDESNRIQKQQQTGKFQSNPTEEVVGSNKKTIAQIYLTHLSRNRCANDCKEDSFKEHQYFHLKQYKEELFKQYSDVESKPVTPSSKFGIKLKHNHQHQKQKGWQGQNSDSFNTDFNLRSSKFTPRSQTSPNRASFSSRTHEERIKQQPKAQPAILRQTLFKFMVKKSSSQKLAQDLLKVKKQILLLLNNIEKFEASFSNATPAVLQRKNALYFL